MAQQNPPIEEEQPQAAAPPPPQTGSEPAWSQVWHLPVLLAGVLLFAIGLYVVAPGEDQLDFEGALDTVWYYIETDHRDLDKAERKLRQIEVFFDEATKAQQARFYQYFGDLVYERVYRPGFKPAQTKGTRANLQTVIGHYRNAEELGLHLTGPSLHRYAQTLVSLGEEDEALALLRKMDKEPPEQRYRLIRMLIERHRELPPDDRDLEMLAMLVERYRSEVTQEPDAELRRAAQVWATGLEAQMRLEAGDPNGAIRLLVLERLPRLQQPGRDNADLAPLIIKLAQAYQQIAAFDKAGMYYEEARAMIGNRPSSDLLAEVLVGLGQLELAQAGQMNVDKAREHFSRVVKDFASSPAHIDGLIGLADCEARLGMDVESAEHFRLAVGELMERAPEHDPRRAILTDTVDAHVTRAVDREDYDRTLELLQILKPMYGESLPAKQVLRFAVTHEKIAGRRTQEAEQTQAALEAGQPNATIAAKQLAYQEAVVHNELAGDYYLKHSQLVTISDDEAHGQSLWRAAAAYDRAQLWSKAIDVYALFVNQRINDPVRVRARAQLGKAYLADGQYEPATEQFLQLLADHPHSPETYDTLVPLAQAYIAIGDTSAARRGLEQVITDHPSITPESPEYEYALIELGKLLYRLGEHDPDFYVPAIERLSEAVERYGETGQGPTLRFLLADAYRKSVAKLETMLAERQSKNDQLQLQAERKHRLEEAQKLYNQVINELEAKPQVAVTDMEQLYRRNAYFYQADCAFDRGQYELAISLYDMAARRFEDHPAALIALVQIVNAHCELGQYQEARVANEQARWQLNRIPDAAFEDPDLPLTRRHWEDWLRWTSQLDVFGPKASATH